MKISKNLRLGMFFLVGILLLVGFVSAVGYYNPQYAAPGLGSFGITGISGLGHTPIGQWDPKQCDAGQDFIIQIPPLGCQPVVARTDLIEESNYPVFCELSATKINPLIEVEAIDHISFSQEDYPKEVAGIGYYPARAAVKSDYRTLLNSPVMSNIGYAVIVLKRQPNESAIPDYVEGTATARIRYNIKDAYGIGGATFHLPEMTDEEWARKYTQYSFWQGRGHLRVTGISTEGATVSVYADENRRISTDKLRKGSLSPMIYLPGFYCMAGLQVRLDGLENPETKARLDI
ncbi:hypothetical protein ACFLZJ_00290, partial [Nanoarchaeota archaeon]